MTQGTCGMTVKPCQVFPLFPLELLIGAQPDALKNSSFFHKEDKQKTSLV